MTVKIKNFNLDNKKKIWSCQTRANKIKNEKERKKDKDKRVGKFWAWKNNIKKNCFFFYWFFINIQTNKQIFRLKKIYISFSSSWSSMDYLMGRSSGAAKSSTAYSTAFYTLVLVLLGFNLIVVANAQRGYYHSECGDSPVLKYKELAKSIGNFEPFKTIFYLMKFYYKSLCCLIY